MSKRNSAILLGLFAGYFVHNIFVFDSIFSYVLMSILAGYILRIDLERTQVAPKESVTIMDNGSRYAIFIVALLVLSVSVYVVNIKPMRANMLLIQSYPVQGKPFQPELMREAIALDTFGTTEVREQLAQIIVNKLNSASGAEDPNLEQEYAFARQEVVDEAGRVPHNARTLAMASIVVRAGGEFDLSESYIKKALDESPKKQTILFEYGNVLLSQGKKAEALDKYKIAFELAPKYEEAQVTYFIASLLAGDIVNARTMYSLISEDRKVRDNRLNGFLQQYGWFPELIINLEKLITIQEDQFIKDNSEDNVKTLLNGYANLAVAYIKSGKKVLADSIVQKMIGLNVVAREDIDKWYKEQLLTK